MREYVHLLSAQTEGKQTHTYKHTQTNTHTDNTQTQQDPTQPLHQAALEGHVAL